MTLKRRLVSKARRQGSTQPSFITPAQKRTKKNKRRVHKLIETTKSTSEPWDLYYRMNPFCTLDSDILNRKKKSVQHRTPQMTNFWHVPRESFFPANRISGFRPLCSYHACGTSDCNILASTPSSCDITSNFCRPHWLGLRNEVIVAGKRNY